MHTVRHETEADIRAIYDVVAASFPTRAEAELVLSLRKARHLLVSLVAVENEVIIGHVAFSPVTTYSGKVGVGLAPVAVMASHRRRGIAAQLIREGLEACRKAGYGWAVVLGDPSYYSRFGFMPAATFRLVDQYEGGAAFQALELVPGSLPLRAGLVRYTPEFASVASNEEPA